MQHDLERDGAEDGLMRRGSAIAKFSKRCDSGLNQTGGSENCKR